MAGLPRIGDIDFDSHTGEVSSTHGTVRLEPQPAAVLALLASRPRELVTHAELRSAIWGDTTHVSFQPNLHYCIRQVRLALNQTGEGPAIIECIPRRGYRLLAPVEPVTNAARAETRVPPRKGRWPLSVIERPAVRLVQGKRGVHADSICSSGRGGHHRRRRGHRISVRHLHSALQLDR